jgi:hypothetical protein
MSTIVYWFTSGLWRSPGYPDLAPPGGSGLGLAALGTTPLGG